MRFVAKLKKIIINTKYNIKYHAINYNINIFKLLLFV